jgi:subtilisin family serine protease
VLAGCRNPTVVKYEPYESPGALSASDIDDPRYEDQWHFDQIKMPGAWGIITDPALQGSFTRTLVAVLDNGIVADAQLNDMPGANLFLDRSDVGTDGGYDFFADDGNPTDPLPAQSESHGTHVAGTIAAGTNNGDGVAGIGWDRLEVMPVRALGPENGSTADLTDAIHYSARSGEAPFAPTRASRVLNMSLGGGAADPAMYDAIEYAVGEGMTVVAAAGNDGGSVIYPAAFDNVIAVSATTIREELASYSNFGPAVDFAAPGGDGEAAVLSIVAGGYGYLGGTSMATPHVSGVVGLLYSYAPGLNQDAVYAVLANTAKDLGEPGHDEKFGHGLIDAEAALEYLINAGRDYPVQPRTLGGGGSSSGEVSAAAVSSLAAEGAGRSRGRRPAQRRGAILPEAGAEVEPGSVIVKLTEDAHSRRGAAAARSLADGVGGTAVRAVGGRLYRLGLPAGTAVEDAIRALGTHGDVEYAQPNYRYSIIE